MVRSISNPPNPWASQSVEWLGPPPEARLEIFEESARSILSRNESPDIPFRWSLNPYRGCYHGCAYCYARPSHQYLGFGAGTDFDRRIVVKTNAPERLRKELRKASWRGEVIAFSGNTDCYQPLEASYRLTRRCLEVCAAENTPVSIITKAALIRRDIELLQQMAETKSIHVCMSIAFANKRDAHRMEPYASTPSQRFKTMQLLTEAGIPCSVGIAPVIPGINDQDIPRILEQAQAAGASSAFLQMLRLPAEVLPVFEERLTQAYPHRAKRVLSAIEQIRAGGRNETRFGHRMGGTGPRWKVISDLFEMHCRRLGLSPGLARRPLPRSPQRLPQQCSLFDALRCDGKPPGVVDSG